MDVKKQKKDLPPDIVPSIQVVGPKFKLLQTEHFSFINVHTGSLDQLK